MTDHPVIVLYAEDSDDHAFLMQRAFTKVKFAGRLVVVPHGLEAINYLAGEGQYADRAAHPIPRLVLLDIKMPHLGGLDVLRWIRSRDSYRDMPVLMLTSSSQESDVATAYAVGANSFLVKPSNLDAFRELVEDLVAICSAGEQRRGALHVRGAIPPPGK